MSEASSLVARGLSVARHGRVLVRDVSLEVAPHSILAVLGPNGAGKSTLVRGLLGLEHTTGDVHVGTERLDTLDPRIRARTIAYVPQASRLHSLLSVESVVAQGRFAHGNGYARLSSTDRAAIDDAIEHAAVGPLRHRLFPSLSLGEQRRVLVARALATGARILVLDEPDAFLDVAQTLTLFSLFRTLRDEGYGLLLVLHGLDEARKTADRTLVLMNGSTIASGPTRDVLVDSVVTRAFGVQLVEGGALGFALPSKGGTE